MKCLPAAKLRDANGVALHDSHAEVLALRAFNCFLMDEMRAIIDQQTHLNIIQMSSRTDGDTQRLFDLRDDVRLHMYCSEAPCM
jgi:tRNA-specific adenosine deaminase 1